MGRGVADPRHARRTKRALGISLVTSAAMLALTSCSPLQVAVLGVGVDDKGVPVAYIQVCRDYIDTVVLFEPNLAGRRAEWIADAPVEGSAAIRMGETNLGWTVVAEYPGIEDRQEYSLHAWSESSWDSFAAVGVEFGTDDLADIAPGEVLYRTGWDSPGVPAYAVTSVEDFAEKACEYFGTQFED